VTFYLDENLSPRIAEMLRARGLDALSAHEVPGNIQLDDRSQLLYAAGAHRAIVTCDIEDFAELTGEFIATNREHAGIVLVPPSFRTDDFAAIADAVEQMARDYPGGLVGAIVFLRRSPR
jgi:glycosyltransferase involved in cell wall biosynthesis